jgi:hypothetical protein
MPAFIRRLQLFVANKEKMLHIFRIIITTSIQLKAGFPGGNCFVGCGIHSFSGRGIRLEFYLI